MRTMVQKFLAAVGLSNIVGPVRTVSKFALPYMPAIALAGLIVLAGTGMKLLRPWPLKFLFDDVLTVGMDVLLVCRQELTDDLVYRLSKTLFEAVPALRAAHASAAGIDPDRGPTTAIPLHPGAARYYREREILR